MTDSAVQIPGFIADMWSIDPNHSEVSFTIGHLVVSKVRSRFDAYGGTIVTDGALGNSSVNVTIDAASVKTYMGGPRQPGPFGRLPRRRALPEHQVCNVGRSQRAGPLLHRRGPHDPLDDASDDPRRHGDGSSPDTFGATRSSFSATTKIDRTGFGVGFNAPIPGLDKAMLLSNEVVFSLDLEAVLQTGDSAV
jgi:hypothetical protein